MVRRRAASLLLFFAGVAAIVWQVRRIGGLAPVLDGLSSVGWGFLGILLLIFLRFTLRSYAWMTLLDRPAPLRAAVAATISGDALGNVMPLGLAVSEPGKAMYLAPHVPPAVSLAALTAENFFYAVSIALYVSFGVIVLVTMFTVPEAVQASARFSLGAMLAVLLSAVWIARRKPAALSALLARMTGGRLASLTERVARFEISAYQSANRTPGRLLLVAALEALFHVLSVVECWYTLLLLTGESMWIPALVFDGLNRVINVVFKMIPLRAGVDEISSAAMAVAIGINTQTGVVLALVRKARMVVWLIVGLVLWTMRPTRTS